MQDTSLEAWGLIQPKLGKRQAEVLKTIEAMNSATNSEIALKLGWSINRVTPRTNELVKVGVVCEDERRECTVTKSRAIAWRITKQTLF